MIVVNFKTYASTIGEKGLALAKMHERVAKDTGAPIAVAVQTPDIFRIAQAVEIPVYAQHIDSIGMGKNTGRITATCVAEAGAYGTLLNHSERPMRLDFLELAIDMAKQAGLKTIVCSNNVQVSQAVASLEADHIAIEPPELIGGDISVSTAQPDIVRGAVAAVHKVADIPVLCGAGVKNSVDIRKALELGAKGVLLASGVTEVKDPEAALREMVNGLHMTSK